MNSVKHISVIIVSKNDPALEITLDKLKQLSSRVPFEVIVVDASRPAAVSSIRSKYKSNKLVKWDQFPYSHKRTTPEQRNRGIQLARGDVIAFIDASCIPDDNWLIEMALTLNSGKDIVCGPVNDSNKKNLVHYAPAHTRGKYVDICTTISVGIRKTVIDEVGLFDPSYAYGQDIDFFWRAKDAGYRIYYNPQFIITHDWGGNSEQLKRAFQYGKARAHLIKKHWHRQKKDLLYEFHVWVYPLFIIGLPLTYFFWYYPLLVLIPAIKNWNTNPLGLVTHHLSYGLGVIVGTCKLWRQAEPNESATALS